MNDYTNQEKAAAFTKATDNINTNTGLGILDQNEKLGYSVGKLSRLRSGGLTITGKILKEMESAFPGFNADYEKYLQKASDPAAELREALTKLTAQNEQLLTAYLKEREQTARLQEELNKLRTE